MLKNHKILNFKSRANCWRYTGSFEGNKALVNPYNGTMHLTNFHIHSTTSTLASFVAMLAIMLIPTSVLGQLDADLSTTDNTNCDGVECDYDGPSILINELMMSPSTFDGSLWGGLATQAGEWIELYNPNICEPIDISCYYLGNNANDPTPYPGGYVIPPGTVVPPAGFALIRGINAAPVPANLLVENGGNVIELVVTGDGVCTGGGPRLWFPNAGGWFAFYDSNGVPQDAVSWANQSNINNDPCVPALTGCNFSGDLPTYEDFPDDRKNYILDVSAAVFQGQSIRRIPDGGAWAGPGNPTYADCNAGCIDSEFLVCNGTATAEPFGGVPPFSYLWDDVRAQTTQTAVQLCAGEYCVLIVDALNDTIEQCITVEDAYYEVHLSDGFCEGDSYTLPDNTIVTEEGEYTLLFQTAGGCDSLITIELETYLSFSNTLQVEICENEVYTLPDGNEVSDAGNYVVTLETIHGCDSVYTVNLIVTPLVDVIQTVEICAGSTYQLPDGSEVTDAGLYELVLPGGNCDTLLTIDLQILPEIEIEINALSHITCFGENDGEISLLVTGGNGTYNYSWSDGEDHGAQATGLAPGNYSVQITDTHGCEAEGTFEIDEPQLVEISASADSLICLGSDSEFIAQAIGGTGDFTYHWSHSADNNSTSTASPSEDTEYTVFATDENGCQTENITFHVAVISMDENLLQTNSGNPVCMGGTTTVEAFYDGEYPPYSYQWSHGLPDGPGPHTVQPGETTNYTVTVSDDCGNEVIGNVTATIFPLPEAQLVSTTDVTCYGLNDGTAEITVINGSPVYTFTWSDAQDHGAEASGLAPGSYNVQITDANGCEAEVSFVIDEPQPVEMSVSADTLICLGTESVLTAQATGGTGEFNYHWSHSTNNNTTNTVTPTEDTEYTVFATDENGCETETITLHVAVITMDENLLQTNSGNPVCTGGTTTVEAFYDGTYPPYSYQWSHGLPDGPGPHTVQPDDTTNYTVTVTDDCGNEVIGNVSVTIFPLPVTQFVNTSDVTCFGLDDGTAEITVENGTPDYTFNWSDGQGHGDAASGLSPGDYNVQISDANGCEAEISFEIDEPQPVEITASADTLICLGSDSEFIAQATGGTGDFSYHWSHSADNNNTSTASPSEDTEYTVFASDENGCETETITLHVAVISMDENLLQTNAGNPVCMGGTTTIEAFYDGEYPPYSYQWSHGLPDGPGPHTVQPDETTIYTVTVTDDCGNEVSGTVTTTIFPLPAAQVASSTDISCFGLDDGSVEILVENGTPEYSYNWSDGQDHGNAASGLSPGDYNVQISDANGCEAEVSFEIDEPLPVEISASADTLICPGEEITLSALASGGAGDFTYHWNENIPDGSQHVVTVDESTQFSVFASDGNGCITETILLDVEVITMDESLLTLQNGGAVCPGNASSVTASYNGSHPPYTYSWSNGIGNGAGPHTVQPEETTSYSVEVTDQCDNSVIGNTTITVWPLPEVNLPDVLAEGCATLDVLFEDILNNPATHSHVWSIDQSQYFHGNAFSYSFSEPGIYEVDLSVTSHQGCNAASQSPSLVIVLESPTVQFSANPWEAGIDNPEIQFTDLSYQNILEWHWDFGDGNSAVIQHPTHQYGDTGTYNVHLFVVNQYDCADSIVHRVRIKPIYDIIVPTAFTPTSNGGNGYYDPTATNNDIFYAFADYVEEFRMSIFNRWGELIFESLDINYGWNGTYRGEPCPQDVYVYKFEFVFSDGVDITRVGDVTLFR